MVALSEAALQGSRLGWTVLRLWRGSVLASGLLPPDLVGVDHAAPRQTLRVTVGKVFTVQAAVDRKLEVDRGEHELSLGAGELPLLWEGTADQRGLVGDACLTFDLEVAMADPDAVVRVQAQHVPPERFKTDLLAFCRLDG